MIRRDVEGAAGHDHDLIIVGGGIYGACLALESARRGLRPLLLERADFGGATSWNSFRILHGGFRYLQTFDLQRFRESVRERRWFLRTFPELVRPQACLMPLYGEGLKRPWILASAILANDLLSCDRNIGVYAFRRIPRGCVVSERETISRFPLVNRSGLLGAASWYDATMLDSQRILIEILRWACELGATVLNYVEASTLIKNREQVAGLEARDTIDGRQYTFSSKVICNCAGPWSTNIASEFDRPAPELFRPSLAFNVLFDCQPLSAAAVAVTPRQRDKSVGPVYFLYPALGGLLAGTVHLPWDANVDDPEPDERQLQRFIFDLNLAVPGLDLRQDQIVRVFAGLLPVTKERTTTLSVRPIIEDHGKSGGPQGLVSISGVKFTTARLVAAKTLVVLRQYFGSVAAQNPITYRHTPIELELKYPGDDGFQPQVLAGLRRIVREESVVTIDDLILRRLNWWSAERNLDTLRRRVSAAIQWPRDRARPPGTQPGVDTAQRNTAGISV